MGKRVDASEEQVRKLLRDLEVAASQSARDEDLIAILEHLLGAAQEGSEVSHYARLKLAELLVSRRPWRAARLARQVALGTGSALAWALLGLAHTVLGHHRAAVSAYRQAQRQSPNDPWIAHNLGHLMDVSLDRPQDAMGLLHRAYRALPEEREIASSFAHALLRAGLQARAEEILREALGDEAPYWMQRWTEESSSPPSPVEGDRTHRRR